MTHHWWGQGQISLSLWLNGLTVTPITVGPSALIRYVDLFYDSFYDLRIFYDFGHFYQFLPTWPFSNSFISYILCI